ncbi:MFS transporter [Chitinophaga barathri]|uniref:MFS transporter n=1 Tax=Chitinophaga barathri TaxID=1647451 RepID=A0A3N4MCM3_9BACT|nr:MFS transporter [Chitinophaga barathri]RPD41155.1 MFS transporter [Chitinophaga barathri]
MQKEEIHDTAATAPAMEGTQTYTRLDEASQAPAYKLQPAVMFMFAIACGLSVANVYYAQPLLDAMALDFGISHASVGIVITVSQIGSALALLFVVPLGDMLNRRTLLLTQLTVLVMALIVVGFAPTKGALLPGMVALGLMATAMTQGLIAFAATLASAEQRGRAVGITQSGVVIGLLLARTMAGAMADLAGWRSVYLLSATLLVGMFFFLYRVLPRHSTSSGNITYPQLLRSMFKLFAEEPVLRNRGIITMFMFAAFNTFWTSLVLPLSSAPHFLSHTAIGAFGLLGAVGALGAAKAGKLADRGRGQWASGVALSLLLLSWLPLGFTQYSLWALVAGIILFDMAAQAIHVTNQVMIFKARPDAASRLVGCYMIFYSIGSGAGAFLSTQAYAAGGWQGVSILGASFSAAGLLFWLITLKKSRHF